MEQNSINRMKLMMGYDPSKTLNANVEEYNTSIESHDDLSEQGIKNLANATTKGTELRKLYAELASVFRLSEDAIKVIAAKDARKLSSELNSAIAKDIKAGFKGGGEAVGKSTKEAAKSKAIHEILNSNKALTESEIIQIIERNKNEAKRLAQRAEQAGSVAKTTQGAAKTTQDATKTTQDAAKVTQDAAKAGEDASKVVKDAATAEKEVKAAVTDVKSGAEAVRAVEATEKAVAKKGPRLAARLRKARMNIRKYSPKYFEKLKGIRGKLSVKNLLLYGFATYGAYELISGWFGSDAENEGNAFGGTFPPCVTSLPDYEILTTSVGDPVIVSEHPDHGKLKFYPNGRVWTYDNSRSGSYTCSSDTEVEVVSEQGSIWDGALSAAQRASDSARAAVDSVGNTVSSLLDFNGISIKWDDERNNDEGGSEGETTPPPRQSTYRTCSNFPFVFGCINERIAEIQRCLKISDDGKFGPNTKREIEKFLSDNGRSAGDISNGVTEDVYKFILDKCKKENTATVTGDTATTGTTTTDTTKTDTTNKTTAEPEVEKPATAPAETEKSETPAEIYARLVKDGSLRGRLRGKKIAYRGRDLSREEQDKLTEYMADQGYRLSRSNYAKNYGDKFVFKKNKGEDEETN